MKVLAIIPARGGSKGIPRKNLARINGKSLVAYAAEAALSAKSIDKAVISTDDPEIREEGVRFGLEAPFIRPAELASDEASSIDTWRHAWLESENFYGVQFDVSVLLEPSSPNRTASDIDAAVDLLQKERADSVITVSDLDAHNAPEKLLQIDSTGRLRHFWSEKKHVSRRQDVGRYYVRNGICYVVTRDLLTQKNQIFSTSTIPMIISRQVINIDTAHDLLLAGIRPA